MRNSTAYTTYVASDSYFTSAKLQQLCKAILNDT